MQTQKITTRFAPSNLWIRLAAAGLVLCLALSWTFGISTAQANASMPPAGIQQVPFTDTPTATATDTATATATSTATATATATSTATATNTATPTATATNVISGTATATATSTHTPTQTATPTRTGTITPAPTVTVSVSPSSARVNESLTFTIVIRNNGTAPAVNVVLANAFPTYIDVNTVSTSKGVVSKAAHSIAATFGDLAVNEIITVVIVTKVNTGVTRTETISNEAVLTYNTSLQVVGRVNYSVVATTTLPGTGEIPLQTLPRPLSGLAVVFFAGVGILFTLRLIIRTRLSSVRFFAILVVFTLLAGTVAACLPAAPANQADLPTQPMPTNTATLLPFRPAYAFSTPEAPFPTLPVFPVPSPTMAAPVDPGQPAPDTSAVKRIVIPAINLDTEVMYVPFQEFSWYITGLREEVAWLGDTSWPGLGGNTVLAAHITVEGLGDGPFRWLENLKDGDIITVYTDENVYTYAVRSQIIVEATDMGVTQQTVNPQLTLITCTGWDTEIQSYRYRRAVFAELTRTDPWVRTARK